jgi:hypothetical protein
VIKLNLRTVPSSLTEATAYSASPDFASPLRLIALLKGMPRLLRTLQVAAERTYEWGPKRQPGDWVLLYLAFSISRIPDMQPWYQRVIDDDKLWRACGFENPPSYRLVHYRFAELETIAEVFEVAASELMQRARTKEPRVGAWWHLDGTEAETHAGLLHDCQSVKTSGTPWKCPGRAGMLKMGTDVAANVRQDQAGLPTDADPSDAKIDGLSQLEIEEIEVDRDRGGHRFLARGHWWFYRDADAGVRAYSNLDGTRKKAWIGFLNIAVIDHFTHAPLTNFLVAANQNESHLYPDAFARAANNLGGATPLLVAADRGYGVASVYRFNSESGVGTVVPYRRKNQHEPMKRYPTKVFDSLGRPWCKHCGSSSDFVRYAAATKGRSGKRTAARIWFVCRVKAKPDCYREQSILCKAAYRDLLPVWRDEDAYMAMRNTHFSYEHKHRDMRIQYGVAPDSLAIRPKRIGIAWQQLRASAAVLIEWLRVYQRAGFGRGKSLLAAARLSSGGRMAEYVSRAPRGHRDAVDPRFAKGPP